DEGDVNLRRQHRQLGNSRNHLRRDVPGDVAAARPPGTSHRARMAASVTVLDVRSIDIRRGGRAIVSAASFSAQRGEIVALMGASGAGKTTILRALAGLEPIVAGTISIPKPVGVVFQFHHLFANMTAHKNVW